MKHPIRLLFLLLLAASASASALAQTTTYTTTRDACGGKANQACYNIPVASQNNVPWFISIDNRSPSTLPLQFNFYVGPYGVSGVHGTYDGFIANPDGTLRDFYGAASFVSDDGKVRAVADNQGHNGLLYHAFYVTACSGRGQTCRGWHYTILTGSTITVQ